MSHRLGAVLICKNEAAAIERCLASARAAGITVITVCDTGSTDGTQALVRKACEGIDLNLVERSWVNFGHNRSEAFELARGSADWLLALDADFTVAIDDDFEPDPSVDAYMLELVTGTVAYRLPLLLKGDREWRSAGAVHEYTLLRSGALGRRVSTDRVRITNHGEDRGSPEKTRWQVGLLEEELKREPDNPRTVFYLAEGYSSLGLNDVARQLYLRRAAMPAHEEEAWYAAYRAALLAPDWPTRQSELTATWERRPSRLEPLYELVKELNARDQHHAAYRLSAVPLTPCSDELFVHRGVWDWGLAFERSIAAWWVGEREETKRLSDKLLANPRLPASIRPAVERNRSLCPSLPVWRERAA